MLSYEDFKQSVLESVSEGDTLSESPADTKVIKNYINQVNKILDKISDIVDKDQKDFNPMAIINLTKEANKTLKFFES